jgi:hypothetical protein
MKIKLLPIVLFIVCFSNLSFGQLTNVNNISPNGIFDKVFNRFGDKMNLEDLLIDKNGDGTTKALGPLCSSGYFDLYFEVGSGMEGNSAIELARRAVVCQVFSDLSQFIQTPNPNVHVNILIKNINSELPGYNPISNPNPAASSNVAGLASAYYAVPSAPTPLVGGIADNEIWKTINSGIDSYTNFVSPLIIKGGNSNNYGIYHGYLAINFNNLTINWHSDLSQSTSTGLYDLYSVVLHEVTHALGFASLIKVNGTSKFGTSYPYYSRYDLELETSSNLPLITNQGSCSLYSYVFNPLLSTSILAPNPSNCSNQIRYTGSVGQAVYTPSVFSEGSSLSHLEDACHLPNSYQNNQYYTMSYAIGTGPNFMKRYLKPEERDVLCDIGYKVNSNFGNSSNLNFYDYGAPACPGAEVIGINDGIDPNGNVQFYTVVNNSSNPLPITNICNNDFNGFTFECLEDLYGNGYPINITSNGFSYVATSPGIAVLRYVPVSATGARGNITYVYIYISANNCTPTNCNFLNNGDFELSTNCGQMDYQSPINSACWSPLSNTPDIFLRNCTNTVNNTNLNLSIPANFASFPSIESWNGAPNNSFIGIVSTSSHYNESIQTPLNAPLIDGHTYTISFYARCGNIYMPLGSSGNLIIGGTTNFLAPYGIAETVLPSNIIQLGNAVSVINDLNWHLITQTFIYTGQSNLNHLVIYNSSNLNTLTGQSSVYMYIDQVELTEIQTTINLTLPQVICINQTINDLSLYAPITGGTFNGPGVSLTGNTYSFNPQIAGVGTHTISYSYTNNLNCLITITQQIEVVNSTFTASINASSTQICSGQTVTLTASSSNPATYIWNPGNLTGTSISPVVNSSTLFSLTATNAQGCVATSSLNVNVTPITIGVTPSSTSICSGQSVTLLASGANTYVWSPATGLSSTTGSVVTASPTVSTTYTVTGTNTSGCSESATVSINVNPLPTILFSPNNPTICSGQSISITASGADTYVWSPSTGLSSTTGSVVNANPTASTTYAVTGTDLYGCSNTLNLPVTVNQLPIVQVSSNSSSICPGQSATLTASGASTYIWSPSTGLSSYTGSSVSASPTIATTYTVTGTSSNGCIGLPISATVTVNQVPNVQVSASSSSICSNQSVTLTATGADSYVWSPSNSLSSLTGGIVTATPTASTTYTVTGTSSNGCIGTFTIPITVNPLPTIQISPLNPTICSGDFITMTASGADTYNWDPFNGLSSTTGATVIGTPSSNIIYTVTGTSIFGCINSASTQITVNPAPIFDVTPPFSVICQGNQVTLTANGSFSYDWSPSAGLSNTTGNTVDANPTTTTTYSVTATNAEGCTLTLPVTVNVNPTPIVTVSPSNPVICLGQSVNLTASGATTYTWSPSQGLSSYSGSNVMANPSVTTTYIVNGQNAQGCTAHESVTVTVNPIPTVSVSSSYNNICSGQQVTLSATGALNYSWSPSTGLSSTSGSSVIASPNVTTTYNVDGVDANGCSATSSVTLNVNSCNDCYTGTLLSGNISSSPLTGATLRIANNISIIGNVTFTSNNVKIMPGVTITVKPNSTLTLNGSHLYGCESMWQGIVVEEGGKVILQPYSIANVIQKTTLIEDATIAIDYKPILNQQSSFVLTSNNATFNKNETAIRIQSYLFNNVSSVFEVKNCLFTSRNLYNSTNSTWPLTSNVKSQNGNASFNPLLNPYISSNYVISGLKYPLSNQKPKRGLDINYTGNTLVSSPVIYNSLTIGSLTSSEYNVFDNIKVDIYSLNSNIKIQNTVMQFTDPIPYSPDFGITPIGEPAIGTGIFSKSDNTFLNKLDVAGTINLPNQFYGLSTAVLIDNLKEVVCNYNTIRSNRSNLSINSNLSNGERGVYIREINKFDNVQINYNTFYSINKGLTLIADVAGISPTINVLNNTFKKSSIQLAGGVISAYSVLIENSNSTNQMYGGNLWVNNNTIFNTVCGIKLNSWKRINQQINNNSITFGNISTLDMFGIKLVNCVYGSIYTQIYSNIVSGASPYSISNSQNRAIAIESSIGNDVKCNDVSNSYSGLYFSSNCNPTKTSKNNMTNHKYGFVLDNNGIIGQQGTSTTPADNVWVGTTWDPTGTANGRFKNACLNLSNASYSLMYVRNVSGLNPYSPNGSTTSFFGNTTYGLFQIPASLITINAPLPTACATSTTPPINALMTTDIVNALETTVAYIADTTILASDAVLLSDQVYRTLDSDTSIMQNSTILTDFYDSTSTKDIGTLLNVEVALAKDSTQLATTLNDVVIPDNLVEESYRIYYESYINYQNGTFSQVDSLNMRTLAEGCPVLQGSAVYMAEALYNVVYFEAELFNPICPEYIDKNSEILTNKSALPTFTIYPVPNDGDFTLVGQIIKGQTITIKTMDGKVVYSKKMDDNSEQQKIHSNLGSGVYFIIIEDESHHLLSQNKFVVTK